MGRGEPGRLLARSFGRNQRLSLTHRRLAATTKGCSGGQVGVVLNGWLAW